MLTDSDDTEMFDNSEEDKDLASQVRPASSSKVGEESTEQQAAATGNAKKEEGGSNEVKKESA